MDKMNYIKEVIFNKKFYLFYISLIITIIIILLVLKDISPLIIIVFLCAILFILFILLFDTYKNIKFTQYLINKKGAYFESKTESEKEKNTLREIINGIECNSLQRQINPHFLYNTLDSIRSRALQDKNKEIAAMTELLSKYFRYSIAGGEGLIKIREELNHIKDYYLIQKYRFEDRFNMEIIIEDEEILDFYMPKMTLQPIVENAIVHGLENVINKGKIVIRLNQTEERLIISVYDNGAGMNIEKLDKINNNLDDLNIKEILITGKKNGIALININTRIRLIFGEKAGIHYRSIENSGTEGIITIPRVDEFERTKYETMLNIGENL